MAENMELREATRKGYYQVPDGGWKVVEPGEKIYVPRKFKASWLKPVETERPSPARSGGNRSEAE